MPDRLSYDESMLYASRNLVVQNPDLKQGAVETFQVKTVLKDLTKPWGMEGGFAVVYKFRTQSGQMKAIRCFRVAVSSDIQARYEQMSIFFRTYVPDITVDFSYYANGLLVKTNQQSLQKTICPIIVMEWVEGVTLLDRVDNLCRQRDTETLGVLAERWRELLNTMWRAGMAHGDLAGVNVMVRADGQLVLIDYDGVYIPEFSGMPQTIFGQQGYQHPELFSRPFDEHMDHFSALVIYLSLLALQAQPELWDTYVRRDTKGQVDNNMLFTRDDFKQPDTSPVFADLLHHPDLHIRDLAQVLAQLCKQPAMQARFPVHLSGISYLRERSLVALEEALRQNDEAQIIRQWDLYLKDYAPAQQYKARINELHQRKSLLAAITQILASRDVFQIATIADMEIMAYLGTREQKLVTLAQAFVVAYQSDNDEQIIVGWQAIQQSIFRDTLEIGEDARARLWLAECRKAALAEFRSAYSSNSSAHMIAGAYNAILDASTYMQDSDYQKIKDARDYIDMYNDIRTILQTNNGQEDIAWFMATYDEELDQRFSGFLAEERQQIQALKVRSKLYKALKAGQFYQALVIAREIEEQVHQPLFDPLLSEARAHIMSEVEAKNVRVQARSGRVYVYWEWPDDPLIEQAKLLWHPERWPFHPQTPDPQRRELWVIRAVYRQYGCFSFSLEPYVRIYVQVYFALNDYHIQTHEPYWIYSRGSEQRLCSVSTSA